MNRKFKIVTALFFLIICMFSYTLTTHADMGPKARLTVYVTNPPAEEYYLDLLTQDTKQYDNFSAEERKSLNQGMLSLLYSYEAEGWKPALAEGTSTPMWGKLVGEPDGNKMIHTFGYFGVPDTYRIIIVTNSGKVSVSDIYTRKALQSSITYDYSNGKTTVPPIWIIYLLQFVMTYGSTLLIEGVILLLFGFRLKENYKVFLLVNFATQVVLTLTMGLALIKQGTISAYIVQLPIEILIIAAEAVLYRKYLKGKSNRRKCIYAITANMASWAVGFFLLNIQYQLLSSIT